MSDKFKGNTALLLTAIVWGTGFIAQKLGNEVMPPMTFNAVRQIMAALVLCPIMMVGLRKSNYLSRAKNSEDTLAFRKSKLIKACVLCGAFLMLGTMTQQIGLLTVSAGKSGFISGMYIVFTPILSVAIGRKVNGKTFLCVAIAMVGFALLSLRGGLGNTTPGDWWTLVSAVAFGAQITAVNAFVDRENDLIISVLQMAFAGVVGLIIAIIVEHPSLSQLGAGIPVLLYATFLPTATGYTLQIVGQKYTDATTAALLMSLESVFAAIFGAIFLSEFMTPMEILGSAVIFVAVVVDQIDVGDLLKRRKQ
ncbi:MAG: DMT family transporter [Clostridiales bacterium]|nr:DMT family transporter [Candidatus Crickella equi]